MDKLNQWLALAANVGVIAGILFLAFEIKQNTDAIQSQTRATIFSGAQEELWKNMEYPDVTLNFTRTGRALSDEEKIRYDAWVTAAMRAREFAWLEFVSGNIDNAAFNADRAVVRLLLGTPRNRDWWYAVASHAFHPDFVVFVENELSGAEEVDYAEKVLAIE